MLRVGKKGHRGGEVCLVGRKTSRTLEGGVKAWVGIAQGLEQALSNEGSNDS